MTSPVPQHLMSGPQAPQWRRQTWVATALACALVLGLATVAFAAMRPKNERGDERSSRTQLFLTKTAPSTTTTTTAVATFAGGCFWGVEDHFRKMPGVVATAVGYTGGHTDKPTYKAVCDGDTGHAEAVQIEFDPAVVSYDKLLDEFLWIHDPTTLNAQGPDVGDQYRSAIFFHDRSQMLAAQKAIKALQASGELDAPIVTEVVPATTFTFAEGYHQQWIEKGGRGGCHPRQRKRQP